MAAHNSTVAIPNIAAICGPALQKQIEEANKAILMLYVTASRLGSSEPLAPALLGVTREFLNVFAEEVAGREAILASSYGFPIFEPRIKDPATLLSVAREGSGGITSIAELTRSFDLSIVERATRKPRSY